MSLVYDFPPSQEIKQFGEIVVGSHFLADGQLFLKDGKSFECNFEVAYTQENFAAVVVYMTLPRSLGEHERIQIRQQLIHEGAMSLEGRDRLWGFLVKVNDLNFLRVQYEELSLNPRIIAFIAQNYEIKAEDGPDSDDLVFLLVNFSLPAWYSDDAVKGADENKRRYLEVKLQDRSIAKIFFIKDSDHANYPSEPLTYLSINLGDIPVGWTSEQITDLICALLSICLGRDIKFVNWRVPIKSGWPTTPRQFWVTRSIKHQPFYSYLSDGYPYAPVHFDQTIAFLAIALSTLTQRTYEEVAEYIRLLILYVDFASSDSTSHTMQGRLLTTLAEEICKIWKDTEETKKEKKHLVSRPESKKLIEILDAAVKQQAHDIFVQRVDETNKAFEQRIIEVRERIEPILRDHLNKETFESKLKELFIFYGYEVSENAYGSIHKNIRAFVNSRNSLVHSGCLAHENLGLKEKDKITFCNREDHKLTHEMENILQMIPMMFAAIFGYKDKYRSAINKTSGKWVTPTLVNK